MVGTAVHGNGTGKPNQMDADYAWDGRSDSDNAHQATNAKLAINTPEKRVESTAIGEEYSENQEADQMENAAQN